MARPRFIGKLLILLSIIVLGSVGVSKAQKWYNTGTAAATSAVSLNRQIEDYEKKGVANSFNIKAQTDGACELNDENKKKIAKEAYKTLYETYQVLIEFNKSIMKYFSDENGSCHYLNNRLIEAKDRFGSLSDDENRYELKFSQTAHAGATEVDRLDKRKTSADALLKEYEKKLTYAGIDVRNLLSRNIIGNRQSSKMVEWSQTAKKGDVFAIDEASSELLEEMFGYKVDCKHALMTDNDGSFQCVQGTSDVDANELQKLMKKQMERDKDIDISAFSFQVAFSCTRDNCSNGKGSFGEQVDGLLAQSEKCQLDLEKTAQQRDDMIAKRKKAHNLLDVLSGNLEVHCTCETKEVEGKNEQTEKIKECVAINPDFIEDNMNTCPTVEEYRKRIAGVNGENCLICHLFQTILRAVQEIAQKAYDALAPALKGLVGIGFGIYIAYITLLAVAVPAAQKLSQYLTNLTTQGFKVAVALILLSTPTFIYGTIIGPIIDGGVDFGITLAGKHEADVKKFGANFEFNSNNTYLQSNILQNVVGAAAAFNESASLIPAIGRSLICNSWKDIKAINAIFGKENFFMRLQMWVEGIILYIFGMMIALAVGFYMLDCALQLGIVCAMMPFFVACWPFKITKGYTRQGWDIFLNTFFNFVVMGIIISITAEILIQALSTGLTQESISSILNTQNAKLIMDEIEFGGVQMVMLIICCLIALKISGEIQNITNKFANGLGINIGANIGGVAGQYVAKTVTSMTTSAAIAAKATLDRRKNLQQSMSEDNKNKEDKKASTPNTDETQSAENTETSEDENSNE